MSKIYDFFGQTSKKIIVIFFSVLSYKITHIGLTVHWREFLPLSMSNTWVESSRIYLTPTVQYNCRDKVMYWSLLYCTAVPLFTGNTLCCTHKAQHYSNNTNFSTKNCLKYCILFITCMFFHPWSTSDLQCTVVLHLCFKISEKGKW